MNVLLIASNHGAVNSLALAISLRGHTLTRADDGPSDLSQLIEHTYHLVIIDDIAGGDAAQIQLCSHIRALPEARQTAIWIITEPTKTAQIVMAIDAGATSFLVSPLDARQLRHRIETLERSVASSSSSAHSGVNAWELFESLPDVVATVNPDGQIRGVTARVESLLGYRSDALIGVNVASLCHPDDVATLLQLVRAAIEQIDMTSSVAVRVQRADREWQAVDVRCRDLRHVPSIDGLLVLIRDDTERAFREQQLKRQAFFDPLTGLANRALFSEHLSQSLARSERFNRAVAVMYLDLNNFKQINDRWGHLTGDAVLHHVAQQIRGSIRSNDVAARLGGDEFVVLIEDFSGEADVRMIARRIQAAMQTPVHAEGQTVIATAAAGVAFSRPEMTNADDILREADRALYQAKARLKPLSVTPRNGAGEAGEVVETPAPAFLATTHASPGSDAQVAEAASARAAATSPNESDALPSEDLPRPSPSPLPAIGSSATSDASMDAVDSTTTPLSENPQRAADEPEIIARFLALEANIKKLLGEDS